MRKQQRHTTIARAILWLAGVCLLTSAANVLAAAPVSVTHRWIRLLPGNGPLAGYFTLHNTGKQPLKLIAASSPEFKRVELHHSISKHGMEHMVEVKRVSIAPGSDVHFAPGGYHLMMWRKHALKVGEQVPVTLRFAHGAHVRVLLKVKGATG